MEIDELQSSGREEMKEQRNDKRGSTGTSKKAGQKESKEGINDG